MIRAFDRFFFAPLPDLSSAVFRFVFGFNALVMYALRMEDWRFYFTDVGFVKSEWALDILPEFYRPYIALYPRTASAAFLLHVLFLIALAVLTVGFASRWAALFAFVLHLSFMQRNFSIAYGADIVNTFFLFALIFIESDRVFSLRAWLWRPARRSASLLSGWFSTIGVRLVQIQLCIIYGYTGMEKLKGPTWWDGTAVWSVIGNRQIMMFDNSWLKHFPLAIAFGTLSTVAFEIYFPALIWIKPIRKWVMIFGIGLHAMIALSVGLVFFSTVMVSAYFVFIDADVLRAWLRRVPRRWVGE